MGQRVEPRQTRGSSCANNPDGPCAKSAPARCPRHCGSEKGSWVYDTIAADWRAYWPGDTRVCRSNVDASSSGNPGRKTCCNPGTYVAWVLGSSRAETNTTAARIKTKQRGPRRTKRKKQEELSGQEPEEKQDRVWKTDRIIQARPFSDFVQGADQSRRHCLIQFGSVRGRELLAKLGWHSRPQGPWPIHRPVRLVWRPRRRGC